MADSNQRVNPVNSEANDGEMSETEIDQNLADTFPASDPPSWTLGNPHDPVAPIKSSNKTSAPQDNETE